MSYFGCWFEKFSDLFLGVLMLIIGTFFLVIGVTVLPVIGIFVSIPVFGIALSFLGAPLGEACSFHR